MIVLGIRFRRSGSVHCINVLVVLLRSIAKLEVLLVVDLLLDGHAKGAVHLVRLLLNMEGVRIYLFHILPIIDVLRHLAIVLLIILMLRPPAHWHARLGLQLEVVIGANTAAHHLQNKK